MSGSVTFYSGKEVKYTVAALKYYYNKISQDIPYMDQNDVTWLEMELDVIRQVIDNFEYEFPYLKEDKE